jgi:hypothetical protein
MELRKDLETTATSTAWPDFDERDELKWRIRACLRARIPDLQGIKVSVSGNTAAIRGRLRSPHEKRLCLECCRHIPGVMRVIDELIVLDESPLYWNPGETFDFGPPPQ